SSLHDQREQLVGISGRTCQEHEGKQAQGADVCQRPGPERRAQDRRIGERHPNRCDDHSILQRQGSIRRETVTNHTVVDGLLPATTRSARFSAPWGCHAATPGGNSLARSTVPPRWRGIGEYALLVSRYGTRGKARSGRPTLVPNRLANVRLLSPLTSHASRSFSTRHDRLTLTHGRRRGSRGPPE